MKKVDNNSDELRGEYQREDFGQMVRGKYVKKTKKRPMNAVTVKEAERNLEQLIEKVIADAEPTIVITESGQ